MARFEMMLFIALVILFVCTAPCFEARKLLNSKDKKNTDSARSREANLLLNALPKGKISPSSPSKRGHAAFVNYKKKQYAGGHVDRNLESVPSPGIGHRAIRARLF
nr:precursor of CEP14-like [Nicotiana tomentosiformis]